MNPDEIRPGTVVKLKKAHPCGGHHWEVLRVGMDVKIRCKSCERIVTLPRRKFNQSVQSIIEDQDSGD